MATRALDVVTIMKALTMLDDELGLHSWMVRNKEQGQTVLWLEAFREYLTKVTGLNVKASKLFQELNAFLSENKFKPVIEPFDSSMGLGVVAILDKLVKWVNGAADKTTIRASCRDLDGFKIPNSGVNIYKVQGFNDPRSILVELLTKSDDTLWIFMHNDDSLSGLDLVKLSFDVMSGHRQYNRSFEGAHVPMLDFDIEPDISWLCGMSSTGRDGNYSITQANQQFKMRMDETGARVKVATSMVTYRGMPSLTGPLVVDRPFYGWWTQKGLEALPMAAFFADWDSMKKPAGSLEYL